jgi:hypothetical protein
MIGYHKKDGINRLEDDFPNPDAIGPRWYEQNVLNLTPNPWARFNGLNGRRWLNWPMSLVRAFGGPKVTFSKFQKTSGIGHVANVDHLMQAQGRSYVTCG